jgi:hypothetical protein
MNRAPYYPVRSSSPAKAKQVKGKSQPTPTMQSVSSFQSPLLLRFKKQRIASYPYPQSIVTHRENLAGNSTWKIYKTTSLASFIKLSLGQ